MSQADFHTSLWIELAAFQRCVTGEQMNSARKLSLDSSESFGHLYTEFSSRILSLWQALRLSILSVHSETQRNSVTKPVTFCYQRHRMTWSGSRSGPHSVLSNISLGHHLKPCLMMAAALVESARWGEEEHFLPCGSAEEMIPAHTWPAALLQWWLYSRWPDLQALAHQQQQFYKLAWVVHHWHLVFPPPILCETYVHKAWFFL